MNLHRRLEELLELESAYWKQRSQSNQRRFGDRNTAYFHHRASSRHRVNIIHKIQNSYGTTVSIDSAIADVAVKFFSALFSSNQQHPYFNEQFETINFNTLSASDQRVLAAPFTSHEIHVALQSMHPTKASDQMEFMQISFKRNGILLDLLLPPCCFSNV